jgi:hypothetical protein
MNDAALIDSFRKQIGWCEQLGSPFTARIVEALADDWQQGGALRELLPEWPGDPTHDALPLRVAGALHGLVLAGLDAELAALYPPHAVAFGAATATAIRRALREHPEQVRDYLRVAPQTNEIGRSAVLLGGFATLAQETGLPLAVLEIGASAGLNQWWDNYRYALASTTWGDAASSVIVRSDWQGTPPALPDRIAVARRAGCDVAPIDLRAAGAAQRLLSYVWPDQQERLARLRAAIELARAQPHTVRQADAAPWAEQQLAAAAGGVVTVLVHSIVWQYLGDASRERIRAALARAGEQATRDAPLAWLRLEPSAAAGPQLKLTLWPGGERRVLADAHPHGAWVRWR